MTKLNHSTTVGFGKICHEDDYKLGIVAGKLGWEWWILERRKGGGYRMNDLVNDPDRLRLFIDGVNESGSHLWKDIAPELAIIQKQNGKALFAWRLENWSGCRNDGFIIYSHVQKAIAEYTVSDPQLERIACEVAETLHRADDRNAEIMAYSL